MKCLTQQKLALKLQQALLNCTTHRMPNLLPGTCIDFTQRKVTIALLDTRQDVIFVVINCSLQVQSLLRVCRLDSFGRHDYRAKTNLHDQGNHQLLYKPHGISNLLVCSVGADQTLLDHPCTKREEYQSMVLYTIREGCCPSIYDIPHYS